MDLGISYWFSHLNFEVEGFFQKIGLPSCNMATGNPHVQELDQLEILQLSDMLDYEIMHSQISKQVKWTTDAGWGVTSWIILEWICSVEYDAHLRTSSYDILYAVFGDDMWWPGHWWVPPRPAMVAPLCARSFHWSWPRGGKSWSKPLMGYVLGWAFRAFDFGISVIHRYQLFWYILWL